jgi:hypothetical protein
MSPAPWTVTRISLFARGLRDLREKRDGRDGEEFEVRSSGFSELRTQNFELRVAPVAHVLLVSLTIPNVGQRIL